MSDSSSSQDSCLGEVPSRRCAAAAATGGPDPDHDHDEAEKITHIMDMNSHDVDDDGEDSSRHRPSTPAHIIAEEHHNECTNRCSITDEEVPNLANLVAATIRDRVVLEQMEEIRALKAQLNATQSVEITGPNGSPVYARGNFANGDFNATSLQSLESDAADGASSNIDETGLFWDVGLEMVHGSTSSSSSRDDDDSTNNKTIPLNNLSNIEIRLGGILYTTSAEVEGTSMAFGIRPGNQFDLQHGKRNMSRSAVCEFNTEYNLGSSAGGRAALLTFHVPQFPCGHWRSLQSVAMLNRSIALRQQEQEEEREQRREIREVERRERIERGEIEDDDDEDSNEESDYESDYDEDDDDDQEPLDVYNYLTLCLSKRHPEQRADITSVSLCVKSVRGRIESIRNRGEEFEAVRRKVFRKIDNMYQEALENGGSLVDEFAHLE